MSTRTVIPMGPQHPVFPEPLQLKLSLKDEKIVDVAPALGYVHRGIEKAAEKNDFTQNVFLVERICGICSFIHAVCYCMAIEDIMKIELPPRANYLRVIWGELHRLHSHMLWLGLLADSFGFESLFMKFWEIRERILDILEKTTGARVIISACAIGGVRRDISDEHLQEILTVIDKCEKELNGIIPVVMSDTTVKRRTVGVGVIEKEKAIHLGIVGPVLRASGIAQDARMTGYGAYKYLDFKPVVEESGDCYARAVVRAKETYQSIGLLRKAINQLPSGDILTKYKGNPGKAAAVSRVEQPRGELIYYVEGNGTKNLERVRVRTPTFSNVPALSKMLPGMELADAPVIVLSIDPCISCTER
ncbi:MAG: nickel-dependent hydrogenase large subunit [Firmicutes bacterium]|nr:nickel-dependent hydrogenase large subunit [Bacillota bacterium]